MRLVELKSKYPAFFSRINKRLFGDRKYKIYKDFLVVEFSKQLGSNNFAGYNIYKINNDSLDYVKSIEKDYKQFIDNLIKEGAQ
jgi:hypothetical protein